jgi:hypothetical protein
LVMTDLFSSARRKSQLSQLRHSKRFRMAAIAREEISGKFKSGALVDVLVAS